MLHNDSYKLSLVFAITLHAVLIFFLVAKTTTSRPKVIFSGQGSVIKATALSKSDFDKLIQKNQHIQEKSVLPPKEKLEEKKDKDINKQVVADKAKNKKIQIDNFLKEDLLAEHAKEIAKLKKDKQKHKKDALKKKQQQMEKMLQNEILEEQKQLASQKGQVEEGGQGQAAAGEVDKYKALIIQAISSQWIVPEGVDNSLVCKLLINLAPGGVVLNTQILKNSGNAALDRSVQAAVLKASPLPVPEDPKLFDNVRTINLTVRPEGIAGV